MPASSAAASPWLGSHRGSHASHAATGARCPSRSESLGAFCYSPGWLLSRTRMSLSVYAGPRVRTDQAEDRRRGQPSRHQRAARRGADQGIDIDIDAKSEVCQLRRELAAAGGAVVVATSEFEELVYSAYQRLVLHRAGHLVSSRVTTLPPATSSPSPGFLLSPRLGIN